MSAGWRLLVDPSADGAWNMAVDEALLEGYLRRPDRPPTLRLYGWRPPALSLGRSQAAASGHDPAYLRARGLDLVRRPSGGLAVLHDRERTYAVAGSLRVEPFRAGVLETYRRIAAAVACGLQALGLPAAGAEEPAAARVDPRGAAAACFAATARHEIAIRGRKVVGAAQLRRRSAFLQHGSILLHSDADALAAAVGGAADPERFSDLAGELGREVAAEELDRELVRAFGSSFAARMVPDRLSSSEALRAARLRAWKYLSASWTLEAESGARERRWGPLASSP